MFLYKKVFYNWLLLWGLIIFESNVYELRLRIEKQRNSCTFAYISGIPGRGDSTEGRGKIRAGAAQGDRVRREGEVKLYCCSIKVFRIALVS